MANIRERAFAWLGVVVFTGSALALSAAVIIQQILTSHSNSSNTSTTTTSNTKGQTLQGKQLTNFTPVSSIGQLTATDLTVGTGQAVKAGDTVTVDYTGAVAATGIIFQSSLDTGQPVSFGLSQVIKGWQEGMVGMKVGGERRLLIPATDAYGANPPQGSGIPANADLVFDITLHKIGS